MWSEFELRDYIGSHSTLKSRAVVVSKLIKLKEVAALAESYCEGKMTSDNKAEKLHWWYYRLTSYPHYCKKCGKPITFFTTFGRGYVGRKSYCSVLCNQNSDNMKAAKTKHWTDPVNIKAREDSMIEKFGIRNMMQDVTIASKCFKNSKKKFVLPSGKTIALQGYEPLAIVELLKIYSEEEILSSMKDMPKIMYQLNGKTHRYFPDFYIPKDNLIIEVKSDYTLKHDSQKNRAKFEATMALGFSFKLMMF